MKRSEALKPLSREHHHALFVAKQVRDADEAGADEARSALIDFWQTEGSLHFRIEEEVLLPASNLEGPAADPEVARMLSDHLTIRRRMSQVAAGEYDLDELKELAGFMRDHVRFEERELFPRIEREMELQELLALADRIEAAERDAFGGPARRPPRRD